MASESEDDDQPFATSPTQEEDFMPTTFLLWGEEPIITNNYVHLYNINMINLIMKILIEVE